jgi:ribosomal 50S subunit-recycling heat shock protein
MDPKAAARLFKRRAQAEEVMNYMEVDETSRQAVNVQQLLADVRSLPLEVLAQVAAVAVETLANRSIASQTSRKSIQNPADHESVLSA